MHGVARVTVPLSAAENAANRKKIDKYNEAKKLALTARSSKKFDSNADVVSAALLTLNPDFYSLWNFRRQLFFSLFPYSPSAPSCSSANTNSGSNGTGSGSAPTSAADFLSKELLLTEKALMKNPKSYSAWHHRLWCLDRGTINLKEELKLCKKMLKLDQRNFHAWNYRRAVCKRIDQALHASASHTHMQAPEPLSSITAASPSATAERIDLSVLEPAIYYCAEKDEKSSNLISEPIRSKVVLRHEFDYTTEMIAENFSNFSAWHHRSFIIQTIANANHTAEASSELPSPSRSSASSISDVTAMSLFDLISSEFALLKTAFFTDPTDQSIWIYHRWLLGRLLCQLTAPPFCLPLPAAIPIISLSASASVSAPTSVPATVSTADSTDASHSTSTSTAAHTLTVTPDFNHSASVSVSASTCLHDASSSSSSWPSCVPEKWQASERKVFEQTVQIVWKEYETLEELITVEPNCKYALLEKSIVLHTLWHYSRWTPLAETALKDKDGIIDIVGDKSQHKVEMEIEALMNKCAGLDPMRRNYYQQMRAKFQSHNTQNS